MATYYWPSRYGGAWFQTPYHREWLAEMKDRVPYRQRHWDADARLWWAGPGHMDAVVRLSEQMFGTCHACSRDGFKEPPAPPHVSGEDVSDGAWDFDDFFAPLKHPDDFKVLHLRSSAPRAVVKSVYKTLCLLHHPDQGGDAREMAKVNDAYARLKEKLSI